MKKQNISIATMIITIIVTAFVTYRVTMHNLVIDQVGKHYYISVFNHTDIYEVEKETIYFKQYEDGTELYSSIPDTTTIEEVWALPQEWETFNEWLQENEENYEVIFLPSWTLIKTQGADKDTLIKVARNCNCTVLVKEDWITVMSAGLTGWRADDVPELNISGVQPLN